MENTVLFRFQEKSQTRQLNTILGGEEHFRHRDVSKRSVQEDTVRPQAFEKVSSF